jgi:hypothetical protein
VIGAIFVRNLPTTRFICLYIPLSIKIRLTTETTKSKAIFICWQIPVRDCLRLAPQRASEGDTFLVENAGSNQRLFVHSTAHILAHFHRVYGIRQ